MSLVIANHSIVDPTQLSGSAQLVLTVIDGGIPWLRHAIAAPHRYSFADETTLVDSVQSGLHTTKLVLLPRLGVLAGTLRLLVLPIETLRTFVRAEAGDEAALDQASALLAEEQLVTAADLATTTQLLDALGVADAPLFQAMTFADRLALLALAAEIGALPKGKPLAALREAAGFAAGWARSPLEFTDYFGAWQAITTDPDPIADPAKATAALQALLPLMFDTLDCPQANGFVSPGEVAAAIAHWRQSGRTLGFARLSLSLQQVVQNGGYRDQTGSDAQTAVERYLAAAQTLLAETPLASPRITQDGASARFTLTGAAGEAVLALDAAGLITLRSFVPAGQAKLQEETR